ncbi:MAG: hypothetical protein ACJA0H_000929, partial [Francisellaceae bacterium]
MKRKLLMLFPGPKYNLENAFKERCVQLSTNYEGVIITSSERASRAAFGNFDIICVSDRNLKSWRSTLKFLYFMVFFQL